MTIDEKMRGRSLLVFSTVVMTYSFAIAGLAWFELIPDTILVPTLWSLPVLWVCLLIAATVVFGGTRQPSEGDGPGLADRLRRFLRPMLFAGVGGLVVGLTFQALLNEAMWLCGDFFTGGVYNPACRPLRFINDVLPWIFGGIGFLVVLALPQESEPKVLTHNL